MRLSFLPQKNLQAKKNKKTKHVRGLERAFKKVTQMDMDMIAFYDGNNNPENWDEIHYIAQKIKARQTRINAFLPLISKDGYHAKFDFVKADQILTTARQGAAQYHYEVALNLLEKSKNDDKSAARSAYNRLNRVDYYDGGYKNIERLKEEAHGLGITRINVKVINDSHSFLPYRAEEILTNFYSWDLNSFWMEYHLDNENLEYDYEARLIINLIDVSPEREFVEKHTDTKKIKYGWKYLLDKKGNVKKDSLGNDIKVDKYKTIKARVTEITREKRAFVNGTFQLVNLRDNNVLDSEEHQVEAVFNDFSSWYKGNKKALCDKSRRSLRKRPLPFPDDITMILDATENLKAVFKGALYEINV